MLLRKLFWNLFLPMLLLLSAVIVALAAYFVGSSRQLFLSQTERELHQTALLWQAQALHLTHSGTPEHRQAACRELKIITGSRVTLISPEGTVLADTDEDPEAMDNHAKRPEILAAMEQGYGVCSRFSHTIRQPMMYYAIRLEADGQLYGFLRLARPLSAIENMVASMRKNTLVVAIIVLGLATAITALLARQIASPLDRLTQAIEAAAEGDFERRVPFAGTEEIQRLALAFNRMLVRLRLVMRESSRQAEQLRAILDNMAEGVIAVDREQHIVSINSAGADLLEVSPHNSIGRLLAEVVRYPDVLEASRMAMQNRRSMRIDAVITRSDGTELRAEIRANPLFDEHHQVSGAVLVVHDITRLWRLERIRRDFVANVSHELKTPITSIKGSAETLLDGAVDDPEARLKFLDVIRRHADRLNAIITDLLTLSRLEQEEETRHIARQPTPVRALLEEAAQVCRHRALEKNISIEITCPSELTAYVAPDLMEQAIINLLDNAIKYSEPGKSVRLVAHPVNGRVQIRVIDQGCGIPKEHLPRIFERFYRVDKARSRAVGGTGLGLAIVKHIVGLHQGTVSVDSEVGQGSTFTLDIPAALSDRG